MKQLFLIIIVSVVLLNIGMEIPRSKSGISLSGIHAGFYQSGVNRISFCIAKSVAQNAPPYSILFSSDTARIAAMQAKTDEKEYFLFERTYRETGKTESGMVIFEHKQSLPLPSCKFVDVSNNLCYPIILSMYAGENVLAN